MNYGEIIRNPVGISVILVIALMILFYFTFSKETIVKNTIHCFLLVFIGIYYHNKFLLKEFESKEYLSDKLDIINNLDSDQVNVRNNTVGGGYGTGGNGFDMDFIDSL